MSECPKLCIRGMAQTQPTPSAAKISVSKKQTKSYPCQSLIGASLKHQKARQADWPLGPASRALAVRDGGRAGGRGGAAWAERVFYYSRADAGVPAAFRYAQHDRLANKEL